MLAVHISHPAATHRQKRTTCLCVALRTTAKEVFFMKGYVTASGYMGYVENEYILFASEDDYFEYVDSLNF